MANRDFKKIERIIKDFSLNIDEGSDSKLEDVCEVSPTTETQTILPTEGFDGFKKVEVDAVNAEIDSNITAENIKKDVTILGVTGLYEAPTIPEYEGNYEVTENNITLATTGKQLTDDITVNIEIPENPLDNATVGRLYEVVENSGEKSLSETDDQTAYYYYWDSEEYEYLLRKTYLEDSTALIYFDGNMNKYSLNYDSWYHYVSDSGTSFSEYTFEYETLYYYNDYGTFDQVKDERDNALEESEMYMYEGMSSFTKVKDDDNNSLVSEGVYAYEGNAWFNKLDTDKYYFIDSSGATSLDMTRGEVYYVDGNGAVQYTSVSGSGLYEYDGEGGFTSSEYSSWYHVNDCGGYEKVEFESSDASPYYYYVDAYSYCSFELHEGLCDITIDSGIPIQTPLNLNNNALYIHETYDDFTLVELPAEGVETSIVVDGITYKLSRPASE